MASKRRRGAAAVEPPSSTGALTSPSSSSSSSERSKSGTLTALPAVLASLLDTFLGVQSRRPLAHTVSRAFRETETKKCGGTDAVCLGSPVPRVCVDGCVLRGERLVAQAFALDPEVIDRLRFERLGKQSYFSVSFAYFREDDDDDDESKTERNTEERPRADGENARGTLTATFTFREPALEPYGLYAHLAADALEWEALYLPEPEPNAIVREITAAIAHEERRSEKAARDSARTRGRPLPIDFLPALRRLRSLYRPLSDFGRLMTDLTDRTFVERRSASVRRVDNAGEAKRLLESWRAVTGQPFPHELPTASRWLHLYPVPWVARVLHAMFRSGNEARSWRVTTAHRFGGILSGRVPSTEIGVVVRRLLQEPTDVFNALEYSSPVATPGADPSALALLSRGIRVWRGPDIVAGRLRVTNAEFARRFPETVAIPHVMYAFPPETAATNVEEEKKEDEQ